jgi:hypothetical protein
MAMIESLGGINPDEPPPNVQEPDRVPVNPEIVSKLADKSDEEVQSIAERMVAALREQSIAFDYVPEVGQRDKNIRFVAQYAS